MKYWPNMLPANMVTSPCQAFCKHGGIRELTPYIFSLKLELHDEHEGWTKNLHFNPINKKAAHFSCSRLWVSGNLKPSKNAEADLKQCRKYEVLQSLLCLWSLHSMFECAQMQLLRVEPGSHGLCRNCPEPGIEKKWGPPCLVTALGMNSTGAIFFP